MVVPLLNSLSIHILPPFLSTKSLHKANPNPEPLSLSVPLLVILELKILLSLSG